MVVNGHICRVRENFYNVLVQVRQRRYAGSLWVDALCINQDDNQEKAQQVIMMGEIFAQAAEVLVWLGQDLEEMVSETSDGVQHREILRSLQFMKHLAMRKHLHDLPMTFECEVPRCPGKDRSGVVTELQWSTALQGLRRTLGSAWFERTWIVQEIVLSRSASVWYGAHHISWIVMSNACMYFRLHEKSCCRECVAWLEVPQTDEMRKLTANVVVLADSRKAYKTGMSLVEQLLMIGNKETADPRDKLFGLLGLQCDRNRMDITPSYNAELSEMLVQSAVELIESQEWLAPICLDPVPSPSLPSWVPDLTKEREPPLLFRLRRYQCSLTYGADYGLGRAIEVYDRTPRAHGVKVGDIALVSGVYTLYPDMFETLGVSEQWRQYLQSDRVIKAEYVGGGPLEQAYLRTLFANRVYENVEMVWRPVELSDFDVWKASFGEIRDRCANDRYAAPMDMYDVAMTSHFGAMEGRRMFETHEGYIGLCTPEAEVGDAVFVLGGCPAPVVLHTSELEPAHGMSRTYTARGHCYLDGFMDGEAAQLGLPKYPIIIV